MDLISGHTDLILGSQDTHGPDFRTHRPDPRLSGHTWTCSGFQDTHGPYLGAYSISVPTESSSVTYLNTHFSTKIFLEALMKMLEETGPQLSKIIPEKVTLLQPQKNKPPLKVAELGLMEGSPVHTTVACPSFMASNLMLELFTTSIYPVGCGKRGGEGEGEEFLVGTSTS
jgi:hypothetical protein